jgi:hypothetical protein
LAKEETPNRFIDALQRPGNNFIMRQVVDGRHADSCLQALVMRGSAMKSNRHLDSLRQFGKPLESVHIPFFIVRLPLLKDVEDFANDDTSDQAPRFILLYAFAQEAVERLFRSWRGESADLLIDNLKNGLIQNSAGLRHDSSPFN